jgi:F0F1-type ATP synthase membrane subunit c/vacuolar-type H+-ATPase subunit K
VSPPARADRTRRRAVLALSLAAYALLGLAAFASGMMVAHAMDAAAEAAWTPEGHVRLLCGGAAYR